MSKTKVHFINIHGKRVIMTLDLSEEFLRERSKHGKQVLGRNARRGRGQTQSGMDVAAQASDSQLRKRGVQRS